MDIIFTFLVTKSVSSIGGGSLLNISLCAIFLEYLLKPDKHWCLYIYPVTKHLLDTVVPNNMLFGKEQQWHKIWSFLTRSLINSWGAGKVNRF